MATIPADVQVNQDLKQLAENRRKLDEESKAINESGIQSGNSFIQFGQENGNDKGETVIKSSHDENQNLPSSFSDKNEEKNKLVDEVSNGLWSDIGNCLSRIYNFVFGFDCKRKHN